MSNVSLVNQSIYLKYVWKLSCVGFIQHMHGFSVIVGLNMLTYLKYEL